MRSPSTAPQLLGGQADVDDDVVGVQLGPAERGVDDEGGAVQLLGRSEDLAAEAVRDHDVVADGDAEHGLTLRVAVGVDDAVAQRGQLAGGQPGQHLGQLVERGTRR